MLSVIPIPVFVGEITVTGSAVTDYLATISSAFQNLLQAAGL